MSRTYRIRVHGVPVPQGSKRHVGGGRLIESSKHLPAWRKRVARAARALVPKPLDAPVAVTVEFIFPRTQRFLTREPQPSMVQRPDLDKLARAILDALTGIAFDDDSHVVQLNATKRRAAAEEQPGCVIHLRAVPDDSAAAA